MHCEADGPWPAEVILRGQFNGAKLNTEAMGRAHLRMCMAVGERSACTEGRPEGRLERAEVRMLA